MVIFGFTCMAVCVLTASTSCGGAMKRNPQLPGAQVPRDASFFEAILYLSLPANSSPTIQNPSDLL